MSHSQWQVELYFILLGSAFDSYIFKQMECYHHCWVHHPRILMLCHHLLPWCWASASSSSLLSELSSSAAKSPQSSLAFHLPPSPPISPKSILIPSLIMWPPAFCVACLHELLASSKTPRTRHKLGINLLIFLPIFTIEKSSSCPRLE